MIYCLKHEPKYEFEQKSTTCNCSLLSLFKSQYNITTRLTPLRFTIENHYYLSVI
jgi:hypothetical protein